MSGRKRDKIGRSVLVSGVAICIAAAIIGSLAIPGLAAQQTNVTVDAPEFVDGTFNAKIRIDNVTEFNAAQFDLSFDSRVVSVIDVKRGEINGVDVPIFNKDFSDPDTVGVIVSMPLGGGVSGSGYLAEVVCEAKGKSGDKSKLDISNGRLSNITAKEIKADWNGAEVTVLRAVVSVDAPKFVDGTFNAKIRIDNVTDLNAAQFELSFDSRVVSVIDVKGGKINGVDVPIFNKDFIDPDTVGVIVSMPLGGGVSGSGYLAEVVCEAKGKSGDKSKLVISNGRLSNITAKEIKADWNGAEVTVLRAVVTVDAPEFIDGTFNAKIRIGNVTEFNAAQFDLSFDSSVVNVIDVKGGKINGVDVPIFDWDFIDPDTVRVIVKLQGAGGVSGSGYLAEVVCEAKGKSGDKSKLDISNGRLSNITAKEIKADWDGAEVTVLRAVVSVDAPEFVSESFNATIRIDNITDISIGQFDLSFNSSVVNVTDVKGGKINGDTVSIFMWNFVDADIVRVIIMMPIGEGVSGSGYLAEISFEVVDKTGNRSVLDISNGALCNKEAGRLPADWVDAEVTIGSHLP